MAKFDTLAMLSEQSYEFTWKKCCCFQVIIVKQMVLALNQVSVMEVTSAPPEVQFRIPQMA